MCYGSSCRRELRCSRHPGRRVFLPQGLLVSFIHAACVLCIGAKLSLLDEMDQDVVAYRPERAGEGVEGVITEIGSTVSEYTTDPIPVITLRQEDGVFRGIRGYHTTLRNDLEKLNLQVGDRLAVVYEGKKATKDGKRSFHAYKVRKAAGAPGFGAGGDAGDVAPF